MTVSLGLVFWVVWIAFGALLCASVVYRVFIEGEL